MKAGDRLPSLVRVHKFSEGLLKQRWFLKKEEEGKTADMKNCRRIQLLNIAALVLKTVVLGFKSVV